MDGGLFRELLVLKNVAVSSFDLFTGTVLSWGPVTGLLNHVILCCTPYIVNYALFSAKCHGKWTNVIAYFPRLCFSGT